MFISQFKNSSNTEIDCYENREQEMNTKFLKKANYHRQNKNLTPLILNDTVSQITIKFHNYTSFQCRNLVIDQIVIIELIEYTIISTVSSVKSIK